MEVQFIFMTIAFVIMLIVTIIQKLTIKRLNNTNAELLHKKYSEFMGFGKTYRRIYKYINIENAGDNATLNRTAEMYQNEGYGIDREMSTDRLLVFVKSEEVKED